MNRYIINKCINATDVIYINFGDAANNDRESNDLDAAFCLNTD